MSVVLICAAGDDEGQVTKEANQRYSIAFSSDFLLGVGTRKANRTGGDALWCWVCLMSEASTTTV